MIASVQSGNCNVTIGFSGDPMYFPNFLETIELVKQAMMGVGFSPQLVIEHFNPEEGVSLN
jgi:hypothetical protein